MRREEILVAVAAGDAERGTGSEHPRAGDVAGVDGVAKGDVGIAVGADVANGGESGFERDAGIARADQRLARIGCVQAAPGPES